MPIRIAFCITELDPGGAERALVELVTRLDREKFEPAVFCLGPRGILAEDLERADVPVTCFGARRSRDLGVLFRLRNSLRTFRPAILQTWLYHANILGRLAGRWARVPIVISGIRVAERRSRLRLRCDRWTESLVDAHICVSRDVAEFSIREGGLNPDRVLVIPNGVDVDRFANARPADLTSLGISPTSQVILFAGRLDPQKDPFWLLEAFPKIQNQIEDVHLLFAGQGPLENRLRERIEELGQAERVHLLGWRSDVPELLRAANVLVLPSRWEGMPNIVLEAFAAALPVVAAQVEGVGELITPGETGLVVAARNGEALADSVCRILQDSELAARLGESSQQVAREQFTWEANSRRYVEIYERLLRERHPAEAAKGGH